uniref:NADH-ubiquinone oxidoreductase chain 3 n=1 Tax=Sycophila sp. 2 JXW-2020 TaxID=2781670 RepID=A0A8A3UVS1_9HYME|nr:NADH dehydrogenase subunit 3 [Sycophila sp. 2 JXW-2020]
MYFVIMLLIFFILFFMMLMNFFLSKNSFKNREKSSPFECGFDHIVLNRLPFSLQFYLISMIFLIFDVEIAMILPMIFSYSNLNYFIMFNCLLILLILLLGLFLEWKEGALKWFN